MLICKLCLIKIENIDHCRTINTDDVIMLQLFFPNMGSLLMNGNICNYCTDKLTNQYTFKKQCLAIEEEANSIVLDQKAALNSLCRICLQSTDENTCISLCKSQESNPGVAILETCLPEIQNLELSSKPFICSDCWSELQNCFEFVNMCLENQKSILLNDQTLIHNNDAIKVEVVDHEIKSENESEDECFICSVCAFKAKTKATLTKHELVHVEPQFKCTLCSYKGKRMEYLKSHMLVHTEPSLQCDQCPYKARSKRTLKNHLSLHTKAKSLEFSCPKCSYKGKRIDYLKSHMLVHLDSKTHDVECQMFQCELCSYKTKRKHDLKYHMIVHNNPESEADLFNCTQCTYKTKRKKNLTRHVLAHKKSKRLAGKASN